MNIFKPVAAVVLAMSVTAHAEATPATNAYIDRLVIEALSKHPKIEAAKARTQAAFDAILSGVIREDQLITHRFGVDRITDAFAAAARVDEALKTIVEFES